jgi:hypothetical protein
MFRVGRVLEVVRLGGQDVECLELDHGDRRNLRSAVCARPVPLSGPKDLRGWRALRPLRE